MQFYVDHKGQTSGPFAAKEVLDRIKRGELTRDAELWLEGTPHTVSVDELLGQRDPAEADLRIFESSSFNPEPDTPPKSRRQIRNFDPIEVFTFGPLGCLSGLSGGGLVAFLCVGFYLWGTWDVNRRGAQQQQLEKIQARIVEYVDEHPELAAPSLDDLRQAGVINEDDLGLIETLNIEYHPISADSPSEAILFRRPMTSMERIYYKGEPADIIQWWQSPDGKLFLRSAPKSVAERSRIVVFKEVSTNRTLLEYETPAKSVHPVWRRDSQMLIVRETDFDGTERTSLLTISPPAVTALPEELNPQNLLEPDDRNRSLRWNATRVRGENWKNDTLIVESYGGATFLDIEDRPAGSVSVRYRFSLRIKEDGTPIILDRERVAYQKTDPPLANH